MKQKRQIKILMKTLGDFRSNLISLTRLIDTLEAIVDVLEDKQFRLWIDNSMSDLYQADGARAMADPWYITHGVKIVEGALDDILLKVQERFPIIQSDEDDVWPE
jgi:hypothetical protein